MNPTIAKLTAVATGGLLLVALATLWITSHPSPGGPQVKAEFENAYPLLEGMNVRIAGAVAGSVSDVELSDQGTALITLDLHEGTDEPRVDAIATIRQEDITGDSYVSLTPGDDAEPLGSKTITTKRTMTAPRFDDLLNSFDEPVRQGMELLLVELGMSLERRGADLNTAALNLRPALRAMNQALAEVESRNGALRSLVVDAEAVTGQAASRDRELGALVEDLQVTAETTAAHAGGLDAGLDVAPETAVAARGTLSRLTRFANANRPLAEGFLRAAPQLEITGERLGPFIEDASAVLDDVQPTMAETRKLLVASEPTLRASPKRALTAPFDLAGGVGGVLDTLLGDPALQRSLFGADTYGGSVPGDFSDDVGLGSVGVELGSQDGYPADYDIDRRFLRAVAIPSCETFGVPVEPGCLNEVASGARRAGEDDERRDRDGGDRDHGDRGGGGDDGGKPGTAGGNGGGDGGGGGGGDSEFDDAVEDALEPLPEGPGGEPPKPGELDSLFDFLLGP